MSQVSIFVSHSHQDNEWCRLFVAALKAVGYDVWYDETGLTGGAAWVATIQHEVQSRDIFLLVLTPEAWASQWVQDELQLAIATRRRILPMLLRNTQVDGFLLTTQWVTVIGDEPPVAARSAIVAVEAPPAPGRNAAPQATTETLDELITLCRSLITERRYTEALSTCSRGLAIDPASVEMLRLKGWVLLQINEPGKAAETWGQMLSHAQGERAADLAREALNWLLDYWEQRDELTKEKLVDCLPPILSQLRNGAALCRFLGRFAWFPRGVLTSSAARKLTSAVQDTSVLRLAFDFFKDSNTPWNLKAHLGLRDELLIVGFLGERLYGYPPEASASTDVDALAFYKDTLTHLPPNWREG